MLEYLLHNPGRYYHTPFVVEQDVVVPIALVRPSDLADRVQGPRDVCDVPTAVDLAVFSLETRDALPVLLDHFTAGT